jgi:4-diphosphocytidyl-2-C-methyl-D-erythritol kinase
MNLRQNESSWTVPAPAKLNLFLDVLGRRPDGYHELETLLVPVRLYDSLTFSASKPDTRGGAGAIFLRVSAPPTVPSSAASQEPIPTGPENLVIRALELLRERSGCALGANVHLIKRIPAAAGLGGGSTDAAAALKAGNRGWGIGWSQVRLADLAGELGSDVPFFLESGPAICRGRGERIERVPDAMRFHFVVVKPPAGLATSRVYQAWDQLGDAGNRSRNQVQGRMGVLAAALRRGDAANVARHMSNGLQAAAALLSPWVEQVRTAFSQLDFLGHQLTGSGSAYFGVCRHVQHARRLATILRMRQLGLVFAIQSCR